LRFTDDLSSILHLQPVSQLLERKKLYWGSISLHWGIIIILLAHLLALLFPEGLVLWNSVPLRLYLLEITGLALGLWVLGGLLILLWRRLSNKRVLKVTTPMDFVVLSLLLFSVVTGVWIATGYRFGSDWFTGVFTPYLRHLSAAKVVRLLFAMIPKHVLNFFVLLIIFPFSRLVHIATYPLGYLFRPWQIVVRTRRGGSGRGSAEQGERI
jgi:nitrate reductase gamma subunit